MSLPTWRFLDGDCLTVLPRLADRSARAGLFDPPAGIDFMGLTWDTANGFLELLTVRFAAALPKLEPGGWVLVWAHPETGHWVILALIRAGYIFETEIPWMNAEAKPQPWRTGRLAAGHEKWLLARTPGPRRPLNLRLWRDAIGGRHPRGLVIGAGVDATLDAVVGHRRSGVMKSVRKADKTRHTYGRNKGSKVKCATGSDGGPSRFFPSEQQLLAIYAPRARHYKHRQLGPGGPESEHPTLKSRDLLLPLVDLVMGVEDGSPGTLLDIFAGTATAGEAAMLLGHSYIGIELGKDPRWPLEARERLTRVAEFMQGQASLFG